MPQDHLPPSQNLYPLATPHIPHRLKQSRFSSKPSFPPRATPIRDLMTTGQQDDASPPAGAGPYGVGKCFRKKRQVESMRPSFCRNDFWDDGIQGGYVFGKLVALPRHKSSLTSRHSPTMPQNGSIPLLSKIYEDKGGGRPRSSYDSSKNRGRAWSLISVCVGLRHP